ncbi:hypothetical protein [Foetidibacter luteolus]|uniref:hypothetical protein n=1 Tax=Foetidibacter luteolus TaxID=2608880 RepID=UPI00129B762C|nr:hypothetical protein [Foetidibacter luteolus]
MKKIFTIGNENIGHYYWVGHCPNGTIYSAGQTFKTKTKGKLRNIRIYPEMVLGEGDASVSLYEFEESTHSWKQKLAEKHLSISKKQQGSWMNFDMGDIMLDAAKQYAFKVDCNHSSLMAIGENHWKEKDPYPDGEEWTASTNNTNGRFHRNFDLAFQADIEAA